MSLKMSQESEHCDNSSIESEGRPKTVQRAISFTRNSWRRLSKSHSARKITFQKYGNSNKQHAKIFQTNNHHGEKPDFDVCKDEGGINNIIPNIFGTVFRGYGKKKLKTDRKRNDNVVSSKDNEKVKYGNTKRDHKDTELNRNDRKGIKSDLTESCDRRQRNKEEKIICFQTFEEEENENRQEFPLDQKVSHSPTVERKVADKGSGKEIKNGEEIDKHPLKAQQSLLGTEKHPVARHSRGMTSHLSVLECREHAEDLRKAAFTAHNELDNPKFAILMFEKAIYLRRKGGLANSKSYGKLLFHYALAVYGCGRNREAHNHIATAKEFGFDGFNETSDKEIRALLGI